MKFGYSADFHWLPMDVQILIFRDAVVSSRAALKPFLLKKRHQ